MMLSNDEIILNVLNEAKMQGNELLEKFHIQYPSKRVAEESNNIFVACVSSENNIEGYEFSTFTDLIEILIVIKKVDYDVAIKVIKTVSAEICKVILENVERFPNKPVVRSISPEFNLDFVLTRGHILIQINTEPIDFNISEETYNCVCNVLSENIEVE